jgi:hypothetical protein
MPRKLQSLGVQASSEGFSVGTSAARVPYCADGLH